MLSLKRTQNTHCQEKIYSISLNYLLQNDLSEAYEWN